ncbi:MAG: Ig-like domain-containing protein, partial [Hyphomonas sp.]|nr:Ig-like domain-containing protein [Hyphomonas sp.]
DTRTITHIGNQAVNAGQSVRLSGGGVVTRNADGTLSYRAPSGQSGNVTFSYTVSDGGRSSRGLVAVTVDTAPNGAPLTGSDAASVYAGQSVVLDLLGNDIDPEGSVLSLVSINGTAVGSVGQVITLAGGAGTVTFLGAGNVRYTAGAGQAAGNVTFSYGASDGALSTSGSVSVSVLAASASQTPFAANDQAVVMAGQSVTFDPRVNDADPEGGALTITHVNGQAVASGQSVTVSGGTLTLNANGTLTYAAPSGTTGSLSFTYTVRDPQNLTATATVAVNVIANTSAATPTPPQGGGTLPATYVATTDTVGAVAGVLNFTASAGQTRLVYDTSNRLRYAVSGEGNVREYTYDANGLLRYEKSYPNHEYTAAGLIPTLAQMDTWRNGLADRSTAQVMEYRYDVRGNLIETVRWGWATTAGAASSDEGYQHTYYTYDQAGRLLSRRTLPETHTETFVYDGLGRMTTTTSVDGGTTTVAFYDTGTATTVTTSPSGHVTVSTFNKAGELISQTDSGTGNGSQATANRTFHYNANGQLQRTVVRVFDGRYDTSYVLYDLAGRKVADIGHNGELTEYRYDAQGRVAATIRYASTLSAPNLASLLNPDGTPAPGDEVLLNTIRPPANAWDLWQWTVYDTGGRVIRTVGGDGSTVSYAYDASGRLVSTHAYFNKLAVTSYMTASSLGPAAGTLPAAHATDAITRTFYDRDDRVIGTLNAEGHLSRNVYDEAGQLVETTFYAGPTTAGLRASGTYQQLWDSVAKDAAKDITTRYVYDGQGLLRFTIDALGRVTETAYRDQFASEANGDVRRVTQHASALGALGGYGYAAVKTAVAGLSNAGESRSSWMIYNDRGQLAFTVDPAGAVTGLTYDTEGRVTKAVQYAPLRATTTLPTIATMNGWAASNGADARTTRTYYSARGEVIATIDAEGYVTRSYYHAESQLRDQYRFAMQVTATDAWTIAHVDSALAGNFGNAQLTQYRLDRLGRVSDIYDPRGTRTYIQYHANGLKEYEVTAYGAAEVTGVRLIYDQAGRLVSRYDAQGTANQIQTQYAYDGLGNLASTTDPRGTVTAYAYDKLGRVLTQTRASGTTEAVTTSYQYDAFGQVVKATDARGNASFSYYDQAGRLVRAVDAESYMTTLTYTAFSEVASSKRWYNRVGSTPVVGTLPATPAAHALDATSTFTYDKLSRTLRATDALTSYDEYTYNAFGDQLTHRNKLGGTTVYLYDKRGLLVQETLPAAVYTSAGVQVASSTVNKFEYD